MQQGAPQEKRSNMPKLNGLEREVIAARLSLRHSGAHEARAVTLRNNPNWFQIAQPVMRQELQTSVVDPASEAPVTNVVDLEAYRQKREATRGVAVQSAGQSAVETESSAGHLATSRQAVADAYTNFPMPKPVTEELAA